MIKLMMTLYYNSILYKMLYKMKLFEPLLQYVLLTSRKKGIDETHGLGHSINVLMNSHNIFENEKNNYPQIKPMENIIYASAMLHDMCDKKYMDEKDGIRELDNVLYENKLSSIKKVDYGIDIAGPFTLFPNQPNYIMKPKFNFEDEEIDVIKKIIGTMSYSTVKKQGFPELGKYIMAYHIVREADLLAAYDFDRALMYDMYKNDSSLEEAFQNSEDLFEKRIFRHKDDNLLITDYSKQQHEILANDAHNRIRSWKSLLRL